MRQFSSATGGFLAMAMLAHGQVSTDAFSNWETSPVHPVALSPDGNRLVVCNLPDSRLEVFDVSSGAPRAVGSVFVGLDPVSARFRTEDEIWVANFISDSISIVSLTELRVVATLDAMNEPSDIVFAGSPQRAFVSCAQPAVVQVFDPVSRSVVTNLAIAGSRPRALAVSPDGSAVYVAVLESGNATTLIAPGLSFGLPAPSPADFPQGPHGGQNPAPNRGIDFFPALNPDLPDGFAPPRAGIIVRKTESGRWLDDNEGDWTEYVSGENAVFSGRMPGWDMPDHDVAVIDTADFSIQYATGLMNICMDLAVNPVSGRIAVIGTEALNHLRFEPVLKGIFGRVHIALVDPVARTKDIRDLNPHLDYLAPALPESERKQSIGDPRGIVWNADGTRAYVTGMGSDNLIVIDAEGGRIRADPIRLGEGPTGMALDEARNRLYIYNRFSASISVLDTAAEIVVETVPLHDPTPAVIRLGRPHLYNTHLTSGLGQVSCASCHVDARFDRLVWDLGDPSGRKIRLENPNFGRFPPAVTNHFHPMKGPMMTQTLQGIIGHEPFHWRGDRTNLEQFDVTFEELQGAETLGEAEMRELKEFLATIRFPPNPFREMDNSLPASLPLPGHRALGRGELKAGSQLPDGNAQEGMVRFRLQGPAGCIHCHTLPSGVGPSARWTGSQWISLPAGPGGEHHVAFSAIDRSSLLPFKIPHLRNMYDKIGLDLSGHGSAAGFGFLHDGSVDSLVRFIQDGFAFRDDQETADMVAFLLAFTGSGLPDGSPFDPDRPPGLPSADTHAAVGRQITIASPAPAPLVEQMIALAEAPAGRVDLVVKGYKEGLPRGWFHDRETRRFQSDRQAETISPVELRQLAGPGNPLTYTIVPRGSGVRLGVDRDGDGHFDRDELDFGSDPANPSSVPIPEVRLGSLEAGPNGVALSWTAVAGAVYRVEYKNDLNDSEWMDLSGTITASGGTVTVVDAALERQRFYRLVLVE